MLRLVTVLLITFCIHVNNIAADTCDTTPHPTYNVGKEYLIGIKLKIFLI